MKTLFGNKTLIILILGISIGFALGVYQLSYGLGFIAGLMVSIMSLTLIESYTDRLLKSREYRPFPGFLLYLLRSLILIVPFALALRWPNLFNVFTGVAGILYFKLILFGSVLLPTKEA
jgi:hypothetical protein